MTTTMQTIIEQQISIYRVYLHTKCNSIEERRQVLDKIAELQEMSVDE